MKYIDAEKLYEYLEQVSEFYPRYADNFLDNAVINVINGIKTFIATLQREPRFPQYDNIVDKVFGAGNLEGFEYHEAEMLVALAKEELLKSLQQEHPQLPGIEEPGIPGKDFIPVEWVDACEMYGKWKIVEQEQPDKYETALEKAREWMPNVNQCKTL